MAKNNSEAKEKLINKIIAALGDSYLGIYDKKYYFISEGNGEKVQVAISLSCPNVPIEFSNTVSTNNRIDFESAPTLIQSAATPSAVEITEQEQKNIADLLKSLGL